MQFRFKQWYMFWFSIKKRQRHACMKQTTKKRKVFSLKYFSLKKERLMNLSIFFFWISWKWFWCDDLNLNKLYLDFSRFITWNLLWIKISYLISYVSHRHLLKRKIIQFMILISRYLILKIFLWIKIIFSLFLFAIHQKNGDLA